MTVDTKRLRELLAAATPGPWERVDPDGSPTPRIGYCIVAGTWERSHIAAEFRHDAALIVALRNAAPALLDEIERLRRLEAAADALIAKLKHIVDHPAYETVFFMAVAHGCPYDGPNWVDEKKALEAAIAEARAARAKEGG